MKKEEIKEEFDILSAKYHSKLASEVRGMLYNLKSTWNWTNEDLAFFLDTNENRIEDILSEYWDGKMSAKTFAKINLLSLGEFGMPGCNLNQNDKSDMCGILGNFQSLKAPKKTRDEKIQDILDLFGVTDDNSLDRLLSAIVDVRKAIAKADEELPNANSEKDGHCKCNKGKVSVTEYDSEKMKEPKTTTFDLDNLDVNKLKDIFEKAAKTLLDFKF